MFVWPLVSSHWIHLRLAVKRAVTTTTAAAVLTAMSGCGGGTADPGTPGAGPPPPGQIARSDKPRLTAAVPAEEVNELTANDAAFAFDLLGKAGGNDNFFMSPHSISIALAMSSLRSKTTPPRDARDRSPHPVTTRRARNDRIELPTKYRQRTHLHR
jgi:hypothetical protein